MRLVFFVFFFPSFAFCQSIISGSLVDKFQKPISNVAITLLEDNEFVAYAISDELGLFSITIDSKVKTFSLKISSILHREIIKIIDNKSQQFIFVLDEENKNLDEVVIKAKLITLESDTLTYNAIKFKEKDDRVLGDLLKRLPGIEVEADGSIKYQGKPINKFYVEGKDLLEGAYGQLSNSLSIDEIANIQVLERHQPIKMLRKKVTNTNAGINIQLLDQKVKTGRIELENGHSPFLWDYKLSRIHFFEKYQSLHTVKTNNTADDVISEQQSFSFEDGFENILVEPSPSSLINTSQPALPMIPAKRYNINKSHVVSSNFLKIIGNDLENKFNLSLSSDNLLFHSISNQSINSQFGINEVTQNEVKNIQKNKEFKIRNTIIKNSEKLFTKNITLIKLGLANDTSSSNLKDNIFEEKLISPFASFENNFKRMSFINGKNITVSSIVSYNSDKQSYTTSPLYGTFGDLKVNEEFLQKYSSRFFKLKHGVDVFYNYRKWLIVPNIQSELSINKIDTELSSKFRNLGNNLNWKSSFITVGSKFLYTHKNNNVVIDLPLRWVLIYGQLISSIKVNEVKFEPSLSISNKINDFFENSISAKISNDYGAANNLLSQPYLTSLILIKPNPIIAKTQFVEFSEYLRFKKPIFGFFLNGNVDYKRINYNMIIDKNILADGRWENKVSLQNNFSNSYSAGINTSQYLSKLKLKYGVAVSKSKEVRQVLVNSQSFKLINNNMVFRLFSDFNKLKWLIINVDANLRLFGDNLRNDGIIISSEKSIGVVLKENHFLTIKYDTRWNKFQENVFNNHFFDFKYQFTTPKSKVDYSFNIYNLLNQNIVRETILTDFGYQTTNFFLRPRQFLLGVKFNLKKSSK